MKCQGKYVQSFITWRCIVERKG